MDRFQSALLPESEAGVVLSLPGLGKQVIGLANTPWHLLLWLLRHDFREKIPGMEDVSETQWTHAGQ